MNESKHISDLKACCSCPDNDKEVPLEYNIQHEQHVYIAVRTLERAISKNNITKSCSGTFHIGPRYHRETSGMLRVLEDDHKIA